MTTALPLAAADPGTWITLVFVILGFLGWIMNLASNKAAPPPARPGRPPGQPPRPPARNRDERIQNEIDIFLQETGVKRKPASADQEPMAVILEEPPPQRPARRVPERPSAATPSGQPAGARKVPVESRSAAGERRRRTSEATPAVREQVAQSPDAARLDPQVRDQVNRLVEKTVDQHLGKLSREEIALAAGAPRTAAHPIIGLLRDPQGVRNAVLVSEILGPPPSLRGD